MNATQTTKVATRGGPCPASRSLTGGAGFVVNERPHTSSAADDGSSRPDPANSPGAFLLPAPGLFHDRLEAQCQRLALLYAVRRARKRHEPTVDLWERLRRVTALCGVL